MATLKDYTNKMKPGTVMMTPLDGRTVTGVKHQKDLCAGSPEISGYAQDFGALVDHATVASMFCEPQWLKTSFQEMDDGMLEVDVGAGETVLDVYERHGWGDGPGDFGARARGLCPLA